MMGLSDNEDRVILAWIT